MLYILCRLYRPQPTKISVTNCRRDNTDQLGRLPILKKTKNNKKLAIYKHN